VNATDLAGWHGSLYQGEATMKLVPMVQRCDESDGAFVLDAATTIRHPAEQPAAQDVAGYLAGRLRPATDMPFPVVATDTTGTRHEKTIDVALTEPDPRLGEEGYRLHVSPEGVRIAAPTRAGLLYGVQTLCQLLPNAIEAGYPSRSVREWSVRCVEIEDWPRFAWRGFMLDCSRHFMGVATIKRVIDHLLKLKMNRLHLHLSDNHGWRVEIPKYPKLTEVGAFIEPEPRRHGFYTRQDVEEIVGYGVAANVTIVPEIDLPGHSYAAMASYPWLCCTGKPDRDPTPEWHQKDLYCAGNEEVYAFLEDVIGEMADMFPGPYFHIGGDEAPKPRWHECPKCQAVIRAEGLAGEHGLQAHFINRVAEIVRANARRAVGWNEVLNDALPGDSIIQFWNRRRGNQPLVEAARRGYEVIYSRGDVNYFGGWSWQLPGFYQGEYLARELIPELGGIPLRWREPDEWKLIIGAECCLWSETTPEWKIEDRIFPTILANAELQWRYPLPRGRDHQEFISRAMSLRTHFEGTSVLSPGS
jgi:hexosaminidase